MNIEELNKTQLLLLTLLVNFVTSIATGVLTVSLLDDTSPTITQSVNRIVERTVETVTAPAPAITPIVAKPAPAAPSDEERRTAAIAADAGRRVTIYKNGAKIALATGTYLPKSKAVVTAVTGLPPEVVIVFPDGSSAPASRSKMGSGLIIYGFGDAAALPAATSPALVAKANVKQGESVLGRTGDGSAIRGIVTRIDAAAVIADIALPVGGSLIDLDGNIVGISAGGGSYVPADVITGLLTANAPAS